jgi:L-ornithine N5-oxygenase
MESPFVYDLATLRNPRTAFSYVNYLLVRKRLIEFANSDRLNPLREEFDDYMTWCAEQFRDEVRYGSEVIDVVPETEGNNVNGWKVTIRNDHGKTDIVWARNVVAPSPSKEATSTASSLPTVDFLSGQRIMAMADYPARRNELRGANEPRLDIAVVGSGRQTAEILDDLLTCPRLGNITLVTEDESLAPLTVLDNQEPPAPKLCSLWAKSSNSQKSSITEASELVQSIYMRAYEKRLQSKGQYKLQVVMGKDAAAACSKANIIIRDTGVTPWSSRELLQSIDTIVLGCRQMRDSLDEVQFKRGAVAEGCRLWLVSSKSEGGRALAKDIALSAGDIVRRVSSAAEDTRDGAVQVQARM